MNRTENKSRTTTTHFQKKFIRRSNSRSEKSFDNKKANQQQNASITFIKTPKMGDMKLKTEPSDFFKQLASSMCHASQNKTQEKFKQPKSTMKKKANYLQLQSLEDEIELKSKQMELMGNQLERVRTALQQQKQKRRRIQAEKRQISKQTAQAKKKADSLRMQNRKLGQRVESLQKQVQFLQRISYDEKSRTLISFRQKSLQNQIERLRSQMKASKSQGYKKLQSELQKIREQKYSLQAHLKAVSLRNECLQKQLMENQMDERQFVVNSQEYIRLREKYKSFLDEYKQLRSEYWALKTRVDSQNHNSSSVLSITFSQTDIHS